MYGLIGKKLDHSFSAQFFNDKFSHEGIPETYELFTLENLSRLPELLNSHPDLKGLNVTIPFKEEVISYLNATSEEVKEIGAVNVIKIKHLTEKPFLKGFNTDYIGFRESLIPLINSSIKKALILGTGGASKAVEFALKQVGITSIKVSRNPSYNQLNYNRLTPEIFDQHLLIINTTPLGMFPNVEEAPPIPYHFLTNRHICYDLVYNPVMTKFMSLSAQQGATIKNGLEMLHLQALEAWKIWNDYNL